jgi:hypothetical protein
MPFNAARLRPVTRKKSRPEPAAQCELRIARATGATNNSPAGSAGRPKAYAVAALNSECHDLAAMLPDSGRNHALNCAAFSLAQLAAGGELEVLDVERRLIEAATANGLVAEDGMQSVLATIRSGMNAGRLYPRTRNGRVGS